MFALFKKLLSLFKKESAVEKLCRGSAELDRKSAETRTVVERVMKYVMNLCDPETHVVDPDLSSTGTVEFGPDWYVTFYLGSAVLRYHWYTDTALTVYEKGKFVQPPLDAVHPIHADLEVFLKEAMEKVPGLKSYLEPCFKT